MSTITQRTIWLLLLTGSRIKEDYEYLGAGGCGLAGGVLSKQDVHCPIGATYNFGNGGSSSTLSAWQELR